MTTTRGALHGMRILELADEQGAYCGKLLADLGADVVKIEPPDGDALRAEPFAFAYLNTSKRGVTLDLDVAADRTRFLDLVVAADAVVETLRPGALAARDLGWTRLHATNPRLVLTSITGFGQNGPYRDFASADLVASALGGAVHVTGDGDDPPVRLAGRQAGISASLCAAAGTLIGLRHATRTGEGQHVDVSLLEAVVAASHICGVGKWRDDGIVPRRSGTTLFASVPSGTYRCRDGLVYLMINRPRHWEVLAAWIHEVTGTESVRDPLFTGPSSNRIPYRDLIDAYVGDLTGRFTVAEIYAEGQRRHLAFTPVRTAAEVARDPHLAAREFFVDVAQHDGRLLRMPGAPYRLSQTPWSISRPAPARGAAEAAVFAHVHERRAPTVTSGGARGALAGLRVLELTAAMAGPWIGRFMAACGAEVIRVESRRHPDVVRLYVPPRRPELGTRPQDSPWFTDWNAGKRFVALDLSQPRAVDLCRRIAARSDVVIENYVAGVVDKLGLGYEALRRGKADLVMLGTSGYGNRGPQRGYVTWGPNIEALSGLATLSGFPHRDCTITQYAYPDVLSALHGLIAVLAALAHRDATGAGQYIDLAQLEATIAALGDVMTEHLATGREPRRQGNRSATAAPHGCYRCRGDDRFCAIAVATDEQWQALCRVAGHPAWATDVRFATCARRLANVDALDAAIEAWTAEQEAADVMTRLQAAGVPAGVVQNVADLAVDPQLAARGFFETLQHVTRGTVIATGIPLGLTATPARSGLAGQAVGQDDAYVFGELLGMSANEIHECVAAGAIESVEHSVEHRPGVADGEQRVGEKADGEQ
jgi:crotonobetainyl-CoA:carnitine CoA-transferase CaiB-like acyl-CoA transferase